MFFGLQKFAIFSEEPFLSLRKLCIVDCCFPSIASEVDSSLMIFCSTFETTCVVVAVCI